MRLRESQQVEHARGEAGRAGTPPARARGSIEMWCSPSRDGSLVEAPRPPRPPSARETSSRAATSTTIVRSPRRRRPARARRRRSTCPRRPCRSRRAAAWPGDPACGCAPDPTGVRASSSRTALKVGHRGADAYSGPCRVLPTTSGRRADAGRDPASADVHASRRSRSSTATSSWALSEADDEHDVGQARPAAERAQAAPPAAPPPAAPRSVGPPAPRAPSVDVRV